jgi:hypothetical protein
MEEVCELNKAAVPEHVRVALGSFLIDYARQTGEKI